MMFTLQTKQKILLSRQPPFVYRNLKYKYTYIVFSFWNDDEIKPTKLLQNGKQFIGWFLGSMKLFSQYFPLPNWCTISFFVTICNFDIHQSSMNLRCEWKQYSTIKKKWWQTKKHGVSMPALQSSNESCLCFIFFFIIFMHFFLFFCNFFVSIYECVSTRDKGKRNKNCSV